MDDISAALVGAVPVFKDPALIFVHIPKTGGRFLRSLMRANLPTSDVEVLPNDLGPHSPLAKIVSADPVKAFFGGSFDGVRAFAVVRNPWARTWSIYNFLLAGARKRIEDRTLGLPVKAGTSAERDAEAVERLTRLGFAGWLGEVQNWPAQVSYIDPLDSGVSVRLLRFEEIHSELDDLERRVIGKDIEKFDTTASSDYRDHYDSASIAAVRRAFPADVERFGYEF